MHSTVVVPHRGVNVSVLPLPRYNYRQPRPHFLDRAGGGRGAGMTRLEGINPQPGASFAET